MPHLITRLRARLAREQGFSSVVVMSVMLIGGLLATAAFTTVDTGTRESAFDRDSKAAFAAAEAGVAYYQYHLDQDVNYWTYCDQFTPAVADNPVNLMLGAGRARDLRTRPVPDANSRYAIELMPANGAAACNRSSPDATMIDAESSTFRIRVTGFQGRAKRSVIATFRRRGFLDFIYFTDFETLDPLAYASASDRSSATTACPKYRRSGRNSGCTAIQFAGGIDFIRGPFHTNDEIDVCGVPQFGRDAADRIEISAPANRAVTQRCSGTMTWQGTYLPGAGTIGVPPSNGELETVAGLKTTGQTTIVGLADGRLQTTTSAGTTTAAPPANGVIFVKSTGCSSAYQRTQQYSLAAGCGDLTIRGTFNRSLTFAADNDIIVNGNLKRSNEQGPMIGLIANNFVRVAHRVDHSTSGCPNVYGGTYGTTDDITIEAAILALGHSFIVDNWFCGEKLTNLKVVGAIAQKFRGPVGQNGAAGQGYPKEYVYDDRLKYREPPYFLDPVQASWRVVRSNEQLPAR